MSDYQHIPVLAKQCIQALKLEPGKLYIDGTLGGAGHSRMILEHGAKLISFDQDINVINAHKEEAEANPNWTLVHANFEEIWNYCREHDLKIDGGILLDLGLSSIQLDDPERGLSFNSEAPLDMRLDPEAELTAEGIVNSYKEKDLADIIYQYGEERKSRHIAKAIIEQRPINSCKELAEIIKKIYVRGAKGKTFKIHPATKTFQALRIACNRELEVLENVLKLDFDILSPGARIAVISFHSLEDRIVKNAFRAYTKEQVTIISKKPITANDEELDENPRARSAKLRVLEIC